MQRIPFATNFGQSRSVPLSRQRVVNLFPEAAPQNAKSQVVLIGTPGQVAFSELTNIRGMLWMGSYAYAVSEKTLYRVFKDGTTEALGTIPGNDFVGMETNGRQLCIVTEPDGYIYSEADGLQQITDPDFPGASSVTYQDGYLIFTVPNTGEFFISALLEGMDYDALEYANAESKPDDVIRVFSDHREVWLFGKRTTEIWYNSGNADFPFERISNAALERGCAAKRSVAKMDNTVFWLADDLTVRKAEGYNPRRISTHALEKEIKKFNYEEAIAWAYTDEGHSFYVLTFPGEATFVYDASTGLWHERESYGVKGWNATTYCNAYGKHLVGADKICELDLDVGEDDGKPLVSLAISVPYGDNTDVVHTMPRFQLDIEAGVGLATGQGEDPQIMLRFSDDGGRTWSNEIWETMGKGGDYSHRAEWTRLGSFRQRVIEISISDPVKRSIMGGFASVING